MKRLSLAAMVLAMAASTGGAQTLNQLMPSERDSGFALLFDGTRIDPAVWKKWNGNLHGTAVGPQWSAQSGALEKRGQGANLMIDSFYTYFVFKMEFKVYSDNPAGNREGNSGVFYRTLIGSAAPQACGVEYQIRDILQATPQASGSLYGGIAPSPYPWKSGDWNSMEIQALPDSTVRHVLNGRTVVTYKFGTDAYFNALSGSGYSQGKYRDPETNREYLYGRNPSGYIAIQDYGDDMHLFVRNLKVARLPRAPTGTKLKSRRTADMPADPGRVHDIYLPFSPRIDGRLLETDSRILFR